MGKNVEIEVEKSKKQKEISQENRTITIRMEDEPVWIEIPKKAENKPKPEPFIDRVKKQQDESHELWFERWYVKGSYEKEIVNAAKQGYSRYEIRVPIVVSTEEYLRRRLMDRRTLGLLKKKLPDFTIEREVKEITVFFFGQERQSVISISR